MHVEHKVIHFDPGTPAEGSVAAGDLEARLNALGEQGWSAVGLAASADGAYLVVLTRPSRTESRDVQVVRLAAFDSVRQIATRIKEIARGSSRSSAARPELQPHDDHGKVD